MKKIKASRRLKAALKMQIKNNPTETILFELRKQVINNNQNMKTMETTKHTPVSYKAQDIVQEVRGVLAGALGTAALKKYTMHQQGNHAANEFPIYEPLDPFKIITEATKNLEKYLVSSSKSQKKQLLNFVRGNKGKLSLRKVNRLLHFVWQVQEKSYKLIRTNVSLKEQSIDSKRSSYKSALKTMMKLKEEFYVEKGDFYKTK